MEENYVCLGRIQKNPFMQNFSQFLSILKYACIAIFLILLIGTSFFPLPIFKTILDAISWINTQYIISFGIVIWVIEYFLLKKLTTNVYLEVDENKNIHIFTENKKEILNTFNYEIIQNFEFDSFKNCICIHFFDYDTFTIYLEGLENHDIAKLKAILLKNYPDKVPSQWHNDKNIEQVITGKKVRSSSQNVLILTVIVIGFIVLFSILTYFVLPLLKH